MNSQDSPIIDGLALWWGPNEAAAGHECSIPLMIRLNVDASAPKLLTDFAATTRTGPVAAAASSHVVCCTREASKKMTLSGLGYSNNSIDRLIDDVSSVSRRVAGVESRAEIADRFC